MKLPRLFADCGSRLQTPSLCQKGGTMLTLNKRVRRLGALLVAQLALSACASIQSDAVRELIDRQAAKTKDASKASEEFVKRTKDSTEAYRKAVRDLNSSLAQVRRQESLLALVLASPQALDTRTGIDARAFGYQAGVLYLDTQAGLDKAVADQFEEDFATMKKLSEKIAASWKSLEKLEVEVSKYSKQSSLASVDSELVSAVLQQTHTSTQDVDQVIQRSKQVNKALEKVSGFGALQGEGTDKARGYLQDLINLLQSSKPQKP